MTFISYPVFILKNFMLTFMHKTITNEIHRQNA